MKRTPKAEQLRQLTLNLLELESAMEAKAMEFTKPHGQTPSRWKVLTAAGCDRFTVPQIARRMGLSRQADLKIANALVDDGLAEYIDNPDHKTSPILQLTAKGQKMDDAIVQKYIEWSNRFAKPFDLKQLQNTADTLRQLADRLQREEAPPKRKGERRG